MDADPPTPNSIFREHKLQMSTKEKEQALARAKELLKTLREMDPGNKVFLT